MTYDPIVQAYFKDVKKYPLLTGVEERAFLNRAKDGDAEARHLLVCCNQRFIIRVAALFQGQGLDFLDLINEGTLGLIKAIDKYNLKSKIRFLSYAVWWIRQSIVKALYEKVRIIQLPFNRAGLMFRYKRLAAINTSDKKIKSSLKITDDELDELRMLTEGVISMEIPLSDYEGRAISDVLADDNDSPEKDVAKKYLCNYIKDVLSKLSSTDALILSGYYGLEDVPRSLESLAKVIGVSKEMVRQRKKKALKRAEMYISLKYGKEDDLC